MKLLGTVALVLTVVGAVNWGLVGLMNTDLVMSIFGKGSLTTLVYDLVGLSGVYVGVTQLPKALKM